MTETSIKATFVMTDGMDTIKAAVNDIAESNIATINSKGAGDLAGQYSADLDHIVYASTSTWTVEAN